MREKPAKPPRWRALKQQANNVTPEAFLHALDIFPKGIIIDLRTEEDYREGHIPGAINLNFHDENFWSQIENLDPSRPYFIYCRTGRRSLEICQFMRQGGFNEDMVFHLTRGFRQWVKEYPEKLDIAV